MMKIFDGFSALVSAYLYACWETGAGKNVTLNASGILRPRFSEYCERLETPPTELERVRFSPYLF